MNQQQELKNFLLSFIIDKCSLFIGLMLFWKNCPELIQNYEQDYFKFSSNLTFNDNSREKNNVHYNDWYS